MLGFSFYNFLVKYKRCFKIGRKKGRGRFLGKFFKNLYPVELAYVCVHTPYDIRVCRNMGAKLKLVKRDSAVWPAKTGKPWPLPPYRGSRSETISSARYVYVGIEV